MSARDKLYEIADRPGASEHSIQAAFFAWLSHYANETSDKRLNWVHAIPNGGDRNRAVAGLLMAEGVRSGVWDVCIPFHSGKHPFGYLEFKRDGRQKEANGGLSPQQVAFRQHILTQNAFARVCYSWRDGQYALIQYINA